jgi:hypothetical protein
LPSRTTLQLIRRRALFSFIFFIGTVIAASGWFAEWKNLGHVYSFLKYSGWIALVGHLLQVIAVFAMLLTPDTEEGQPDHPTNGTPEFWRKD